MKTSDKPSNERLCHICYQPAGKHSYYGAQACNSCRAFFRRANRGAKFKTFKCCWKGSCSIDSKSWKSCQACRFEKCLKVGMKQTFVLSGQKPKQEPSENLIVEQKPRYVIPIPPAVVDQFTIQEENEILSLFNIIFNQIALRTLDRLQRNPDVLLAMVNFHMKGELFAPVHMNKYCMDIYQHTEDAYANITDMFHLSAIDRSALLKANVSIICLYTNTSMFCSQKLATRYTRRALIALEEAATHIPESAGLLQYCHANGITSTKEVFPSYNYHSVYPTAWASTVKFEERHHEVFMQLGNWTLDPSGDVDDVQLMLMALMLLFRSDGIGEQLEEGEKVRCLEKKYTDMLLRYLKKKYHEEVVPSVFKRCLSIGPLATEVIEITRRKLPVLVADDVLELMK